MTTLAQSALLVSLNLSAYSGMKEDKALSKETADNHGIKAGNVKTSKRLVPKIYLDPITKIVSEIRTFHYEQTSPWLDGGIRILAAANHAPYKKRMLELQESLELAANAFSNQWDSTIIPAARTELNGAFDINDYPSDIRSKFGLSLQFLPIADSNDFRTNICDSEREAMRQSIEQAHKQTESLVTNDLFNRLGDKVKLMADKLKAYKPAEEGKRVQNPFRDSLVENLKDLIDLIPRMNITNDARLEAIRQEVQKELLAIPADTLREVDTVREDIAQKAEDIHKRLAEFMA